MNSLVRAVRRFCTTMTLASMLSLTPPAWAQANAAPAAVADSRTAEAVLAIGAAWLDAELSGNSAYLDWLLLDGYISVAQNGKVTTKVALVDGARRRGRSASLAEQVTTWKSAHPIRGEVIFFGDTAVLCWISAKPGDGAPVSSSDIFVYRDGRWRAIYSQHSAAAN